MAGNVVREGQEWNYETVPVRLWNWELQTEHGRAIIYGEVSPGGIHWWGDLKVPLYGGEYAILFQSFEDFFHFGAPADAEVPINIFEEIKEHIRLHRIVGVATTLTITLELKRWPALRLKKIQANINGRSIYGNEDSVGLGLAASVTIFSGSVVPQTYSISCYCEVYYEDGEIEIPIYSDKRYFDVVRGENKQLTIVVGEDLRLTIPYTNKKSRRLLLYDDLDPLERWHGGLVAIDADEGLLYETVDEMGTEAVRRAVVVAREHKDSLLLLLSKKLLTIKQFEKWLQEKEITCEQGLTPLADGSVLPEGVSISERGDFVYTMVARGSDGKVERRQLIVDREYKDTLLLNLCEGVTNEMRVSLMDLLQEINFPRIVEEVRLTPEEVALRRRHYT